MNHHILCSGCRTRIPRGKKVWAYGSKRYCDSRCFKASFGLVEEVEDWTAARLNHLEEERVMAE